MKVLRTAALVVGAVALVATGIGAVGGLGIAAPLLKTIATVAKIASFVSAGLTLVAGSNTPKGTVGGNATKFTIDKESGIPYMIGRTLSGGKVVHRQFYGPKQIYESWVTVHSLGPIKSLGPLLIDKVAQTFAGNAATGGYAGFMWLSSQLGAIIEPVALPGPHGPFPGWTASSKLSGLAADLWTLKFDDKGKKYPSGVPQRDRIGEGVFVYDPRLDSTFPGGSGPCRFDDESTYVWSENAALHDLTWAFGRLRRGTLVAGGGLKVWGIDTRAFAEWANTCDANNWRAGGIVYTTADNAWDVLRMIAQAGGAEPQVIGGVLSVVFSAPRVSIATVTSGDVTGTVDVPGSSSRRKRRNTIIPKIRLESHGWETLPIDPVSVEAYVAADGAKRPKEVAYPLVQDAKQAAQLAAYDILNARELEPISLPLKIYALGYLPGDCLTVDIPEAKLIGRQVVVRNRELSAGDFSVTLLCRTETAGKHPFALGKTGTPPPAPDLSIPAIDTAAPAAVDWTLAGVSLGDDGGSIPALTLTGNVGDPYAEAAVFDFRRQVGGQAADIGWEGASIEPSIVTKKTISSVTPGASYEAGVRYRRRGVLSDRRVLGPVTAGQLSVSRGAFTLLSQSEAYPFSSTSSTIVMAAFSGVLDDGTDYAFAGGAITGLEASTSYGVFAVRATGTLFALPNPAATAIADSANIVIGWQATSAADGTYATQPAPPPGYGGNGTQPRFPNEQLQ